MTGDVSIRKMQAGEVAVQFFSPAFFVPCDAMEGRTEEENMKMATSCS